MPEYMNGLYYIYITLYYATLRYIILYYIIYQTCTVIDTYWREPISVAVQPLLETLQCDLNRS